MSEPVRHCCLSKSKEPYNEIIERAIGSTNILDVRRKQVHKASKDFMTVCGLKVESIRDSDCLSDDWCGNYCSGCFNPKAKR